MSRMKAVIAVVALAAMVGLASSAQAQDVLSMIAGSTAAWQALAVGTYNQGNCPSKIAGTVKPCFDDTNSTFNFNDTWPTTLGGTVNSDGAPIWIVWDSASTPHVWAFGRVDSSVGVRCFFANPSCVAQTPTLGTFPIAGNLIQGAVWGDNSSDATPPANVQAIFDSNPGVSVNATVSDIDMVDALWATCRANSAVGKNAFDSTDGLGYNSANKAGTCPTFGHSTLAQLVGNAVQSGYPGSTSTANVLAFAISGSDPFTGKKVTKFTEYTIGGQILVFAFSRHSPVNSGLSGLANVTDAQVQKVFSGTRCDADVFGLGSAGIQAFLREPLSGTMNSIEATVFRRPVIAPSGSLGLSEELGVNGANPLTGASVPCASSDGLGGRYRGIGTGEIIKSIFNATNINTQADGIGYTFFSFGNVNPSSTPLGNSPNYGYTTLDGVDPIFQIYNSTSGAGYDPGNRPTVNYPHLPPCLRHATTHCPALKLRFGQAGSLSPTCAAVNIVRGTYYALPLPDRR